MDLVLKVRVRSAGRGGWFPGLPRAGARARGRAV